MTEVDIHNVRFYGFTPKAIHCMAYDESSELLALSRSDNNIEIWNCKDKPFKIQEIFGLHNSSVEALVWCQTRLISAGLHGFILEYDLQTLQVKSKVAVTGGPTWCLALSPNKKLLAAGTESGFLCIFDVTEDGMIYQKNFERQSGRILSIAWHADSNFLVTGSVGTVHLLSLKEGQILQFPVGRASKAAETIVWCISLLEDMTIVTGDSRGKTCFWDGNHGTLIDGVQSHQADVLSMQVSQDKKKSIFVAGVDPVIYEISYGGNHWIKGIPRRIHTHDVRAMALTKRGKLFSGGVDTYLACSSYPPKTVIKYPATPPKGYISLAEKAHCVLLGHEDRLELWQLGEGKLDRDCSPNSLTLAKDRLKLLELHLKSTAKLECCSVSPNCKSLAYIVEGTLKIFSFTPPKDGKEIKLHKLRPSTPNLLPSTQIQWLDDETLISATHSSVIQILLINEEEAVLLRNLEVPKNACVRLLTKSEDGKFIGVSDSDNRVQIYDCEKEKWMALPFVHSPPTALAIDSASHVAIATYSNNLVVQYDFLSEAYTKFGHYLIEQLHEEFKKRNFTFQSITFHDTNSDIMFLHDVSSLIIVNKKEGLEIDSRGVATKCPKLETSYEYDSNSSTSLKSCLSGTLPIIPRSNHIMHFSYLSKNNAVSIEINPIWLLDSLPPTLRIKKFGGN